MDGLDAPKDDDGNIARTVVEATCPSIRVLVTPSTIALLSRKSTAKNVIEEGVDGRDEKNRVQELSPFFGTDQAPGK